MAGEIERPISRAYTGFREAQLATDDVGALDEGNTLVVGDAPTEPFAAKATVSGNHEPLGRDILQGLADQPSDVFRGLDNRVAVVHHSNANLLVRRVLGKQGEISPVGTGAFKRDDIGLELQKIRQGTLVTRRLPVD